MVFLFAIIGIQLRLFVTTNTWVPEFGLMVQLESKLVMLPKLYFHFYEPFSSFIVNKLFRYKWMTYGEAGTTRSAIGSGLVYRGIPKASYLSRFGYYSFPFESVPKLHVLSMDLYLELRFLDAF